MSNVTTMQRSGGHRRGPWLRRALAPTAVAAATVVAGISLAPAAMADAEVTVDFTAIGIYPRAGTSMSSERIGTALSNGTAVSLVCETTGEEVSNGYESLSIWGQLPDGTFLPNAFLNTGVADWTPGVPRCEEGEDRTQDDEAVTPSYDDPCMAMWPGGDTTVKGIFGGEQSTHDAEMSRYLVCEGFGADTDVEYSRGMKCAIVAAVATATNPVPGTGQTVSTACDAISIADEGFDSFWGIGCGIVGDALATGAGVAAAGVTAGSGPGAGVVGVATYRTIATAAQLTCGALFDGGAYDFGVQLEADHEARVAHDIVNDGKCLRQSVRFGFISWSAVDC